MTQQLSPAYQLFPYESTVTGTPPPMASRWGVSLKQEKPPRLRKFLASLVLGKDGYSGFLANKKSTPLMDPKPPNISQAIM